MWIFGPPTPRGGPKKLELNVRFFLHRLYSLVVLVWSGSCTVCARPRCSGVNKHVIFGVCLFLTGIREVTEPSDTSTAIDALGCACMVRHLVLGEYLPISHLFCHLLYNLIQQKHRQRNGPNNLRILLYSGQKEKVNGPGSANIRVRQFFLPKFIPLIWEKIFWSSQAVNFLFSDHCISPWWGRGFP